MKNWYKNQPKVIWLVLLFALFSSNLILSHRILGINIQLKEMETKKNNVTNEINELKVKVASHTASQAILKKARENGFTVHKQIVFLSDKEVLASNE